MSDLKSFEKLFEKEVQIILKTERMWTEHLPMVIGTQEPYLHWPYIIRIQVCNYHRWCIDLGVYYKGYDRLVSNYLNFCDTENELRAYLKKSSTPKDWAKRIVKLIDDADPDNFD